jgi:hypothetical protein
MLLCGKAVRFGDTDKVQFGMGTYGSRSLVVGGVASMFSNATPSFSLTICAKVVS